MRVYYYHSFDPQWAHEEWKGGRLPAHLLYGACHLKDEGIDVIFHHAGHGRHRWSLSLDTAWKILRCYRRYDAIYATTFRGLELIIFLRALGLFRKPIICWHHQPIVKAKSRLRETVARLFYHGFDELIFFSQAIIDKSSESVKAPVGHMHIVHWGADLDFYNRLQQEDGAVSHEGFISTGKERRDFPTLVNAFNQTAAPLDIYVCRESNGISYERILTNLQKKENIHIHYIQGNKIREMAQCVNRSLCAVICCQETNYTVGLTTVVEALALGIPMICSDNPQMPMDIEGDGCGLTVSYGDVNGWVNAIRYISEHPAEARQMGLRGKAIAQKKYNEKICAHEIGLILKNYEGK
ncbi:MAG: glycosyltransferase [Prevotellaceae bacterium]|nr:glycosyltransferase [Prevotellaceae bacterium]